MSVHHLWDSEYSLKQQRDELRDKEYSNNYEVAGEARLERLDIDRELRAGEERREEERYYEEQEERRRHEEARRLEEEQDYYYQQDINDIVEQEPNIED